MLLLGLDVVETTSGALEWVWSIFDRRDISMACGSLIGAVLGLGYMGAPPLLALGVWCAGALWMARFGVR